MAEDLLHHALPPADRRLPRGRWLVAGAQLAAIVLLIPVFWFPLRWPALTLVSLPLLPALWVLRLRAGCWRPPMDVLAPLCFVLLAAAMAMVPVLDVELALPKLLGIALGAALLIAVGDTIRGIADLQRASAAVAAGLVVIAVGGLLAVEAPTGKGSLLTTLLGQLPHPLVGLIPRAPGGSLNPNELAGVLALLSPLAVCRAAAASESGRRPGDVWRLLIAPGLALLVLALTQSRGALAGTLLALAAIGAGAAVRAHRRSRLSRRLLVLLVAGLALASGSLILVAATASQRASAAAGGLESLSVRVRLWQQALVMLNDYPLTGIGLGQVDPVLHRVYAPAFLAPDQVVPHAHNLLLDYALELGVPGAVAFALLVGGCVHYCLRAIRTGEVWLFWTGLGLLLGLLAFMVFGFTDAIAPGARGGLALWAVLGLGAALAPRARPARSAPIPHQDAHGLQAGAGSPAPLVRRGTDGERWLVRVRAERDDGARLEGRGRLAGRDVGHPDVLDLGAARQQRSQRILPAIGA